MAAVQSIIGSSFSSGHSNLRPTASSTLSSMSFLSVGLGEKESRSASLGIPFLRRIGPCNRRRKFVVMAKSNAATNKKDYYATLNLSRDASLREIKSSYRSLARKYHPDMNKNPGAEEKFKEITTAYEVLSDDEKRSLYDRYGEAGLQGEYGGPDFSAQGVDPFEVFSNIFGESSSYFGGDEFGGINFSKRNARGVDLDVRYDLFLSFEESVFGGKKDVNFTCFQTCDNCNGTGAKSSSSIKSCLECGGRGAVSNTQRTPFGVVSQVSTCRKCDGNGKTITDQCKKCTGDGRVPKAKTMEIDIPPGVSNEVSLHIQGEGNFDVKRGATGDLYIFFHVKEKPGFKRDGLHLYSNVHIDYTEAILGTVIQVETVEGYRDLQIPSGTQPGDTLKIQKMGIPSMKKPTLRGDHHFMVSIQIPKEISDVERSLVENLASLSRAQTQHRRKRSKKQSRRSSTNSIWSSFKGLFGENHSRRGFMSISIEAPMATSVPYYARNNWNVLSSCFILVLTCIFSCNNGMKPRTILRHLRRSAHGFDKSSICQPSNPLHHQLPRFSFFSSSLLGWDHARNPFGDPLR